MNIEDNYSFIKATCKSISFKYFLDYSDLLSVVHEKISTAKYISGKDYTKPWIYTVIKNCAIDMKRDKRFEIVEIEDHYAKTEIDTDRCDNIKLLNLIFDMVDKMSTNMKQVFEYYFIMNLPSKEISAIMKTPDSSIRAIIFRIRKNANKLQANCL